MVEDITTCVTMDAKKPGSVLVLVGETKSEMGGSHLLMVDPNANCDNALPTVSLTDGPHNAKAVHTAIQACVVESAHDCSEGGILVAAAEMAFGGDIGLDLQLVQESLCFSETPSRYLLEVDSDNLDTLAAVLGETTHEVIGVFNDSNKVTFGDASWSLDDLREAWLSGMVI